VFKHKKSKWDIVESFEMVTVDSDGVTMTGRLLKLRNKRGEVRFIPQKRLEDMRLSSFLTEWNDTITVLNSPVVDGVLDPRKFLKLRYRLIEHSIKDINIFYVLEDFDSNSILITERQIGDLDQQGLISNGPRGRWDTRTKTIHVKWWVTEVRQRPNSDITRYFLKNKKGTTMLVSEAQYRMLCEEGLILNADDVKIRKDKGDVKMGASKEKKKLIAVQEIHEGLSGGMIGYVIEDRETGQEWSVSSAAVARLHFEGFTHIDVSNADTNIVRLGKEGTLQACDALFIDHVYKSHPSKEIPFRPSWDEYFMGIAEMTSTRGTCDRLYVGCVIVRDNHVVAHGYNGSISGHDHCHDVGHLMYEGGCKRTIHAEKNALSMCAKFGVNTDGATAYVTHYPCPDCMRELNQAGIRKVVYKHMYKHRFENEFDKGMELIQYEGRKLSFNWE
jgi:dCMP deaminase